MLEIAKQLFTKLKAATGAVLDLRNATGGVFLRTVTKTADYTCVAGDSGTIFDNTGDTGAIIFTLPAVSAATKGWWAVFVCSAAQNLTVATATADTLIAYGDPTADSVGITGNHLTNALFVYCDGISYSCTVIPYLATNITITTA